MNSHGIPGSVILIKRRESEITGRRRDWMIQVAPAYCNTRMTEQANSLSRSRSYNRGMYGAMHRKREKERGRDGRRFREKEKGFLSESWLKASRSVCMRPPEGDWHLPGFLCSRTIPRTQHRSGMARLSTRTTAQPWSRAERTGKPRIERERKEKRSRAKSARLIPSLWERNVRAIPFALFFPPSFD